MAPSAVETVATPVTTAVKPVVPVGDYKVIGTRRFSKEAETQGTGDFAAASVRLGELVPYTALPFLPYQPCQVK